MPSRTTLAAVWGEPATRRPARACPTSMEWTGCSTRVAMAWEQRAGGPSLWEGRQEVRAPGKARAEVKGCCADAERAREQVSDAGWCSG